MIRNRLSRCLASRVQRGGQSTRTMIPMMAQTLEIPTTSSSSWFHSSTPSSSSSSSELGRNPGLESVISQGISSLEETAMEIQQKTRHAGILATNNVSASGIILDTSTHRQLAEAQRLLDVTTECLEELCHKYQDQSPGIMQKELPGLQLKGQPIELLEVQVNKDGKQAKVFWTLPYSVLMDPNVNQNVYQRLIMALQEQLVPPPGTRRGGAKILSQQVGSKLRFYFPPRIKMVPATHDMVERAIKEIY